MKTHKTLRLLPLCAGALLTLSAFAQNAPTPADRNTEHSRDQGSNTSGQQTTIYGRADMKDPDEKSMKVSRADRRFFKKASHLGEKEVALSRIAAERATHPQVRAFASEMVTAHNAANAELAALIRQKGARIDDKDRAIEQRELAKEWNEKKGSEFDEDYLEAVIEAHEDTIDVLENGVDSKDGDISAYASKLLPVVKAHLAHAEKLEAQVD